MKDDKKLAFLLMSADIIHPGHLNIIHEALKLNAKIMVGLYSDEAVASYKRVPFMNFEQRKTVLENIKGVDVVVEQKTRDLEETLLKYKPDYFVHGTDWRDGALSKERDKVLNIISKWGGILVEPEYTKGICSTNAHNVIRQRGTTAEERQKKLYKSINIKKRLRACSVYDCITAGVASDSIIKRAGKPITEFDALWFDAEQIAESKGKKSSKLLDYTECYNLMNEVADITVKPFIFNYGIVESSEIFNDVVHNLEKLGISMVVVERDYTKPLSEFLNIIHQANLSLYDNVLQFAVKLDANNVDENIINEYSENDVNSFLLYGTIQEIKKASQIINSMVYRSNIMALVSDYSDKELLSLYDANINILIYRDEFLDTIKDAIKKIAINILDI